MKSPTIKFQLKPYQLARGLASIRRLDPNYQPSSIHQLVKLIYFDYCAKTSIGHTDAIPQAIWNDLYKILPGVQSKSVRMDDDTIMQEAQQILGTLNISCNPQNDAYYQKVSSTPEFNSLTNDTDTTSIINTVNDFSLPDDLLSQITEDIQNEDN